MFHRKPDVLLYFIALRMKFQPALSEAAVVLLLCDTSEPRRWIIPHYYRLDFFVFYQLRSGAESMVPVMSFGTTASQSSVLCSLLYYACCSCTMEDFVFTFVSLFAVHLHVHMSACR